jgi:hypothetical protein
MDTLSIASRVLQVLLTIIVSLIVLVYVQDWQYKKLRNGLNQKLRSVQLPWGWQYEAIVIPPMVDYTNASSLSEPHRYVVKGMLVQNRDGKWLIELTYPKRIQHSTILSLLMRSLLCSESRRLTLLWMRHSQYFSKH